MAGVESGNDISDIPDDVRESVAAMIVEAVSARERARAAVDIIRVVYGLPTQAVVRLWASIVSQSGDTSAPDD